MAMRKKRRKILALLAILCMLFTMHAGQIESSATEVGVNEENNALANGFVIDSTGTLVGYNGSGGGISSSF